MDTLGNDSQSQVDGTLAAGTVVEETLGSEKMDETFKPTSPGREITSKEGNKTELLLAIKEKKDARTASLAKVDKMEIGTTSPTKDSAKSIVEAAVRATVMKEGLLVKPSDTTTTDFLGTKLNTSATADALPEGEEHTNTLPAKITQADKTNLSKPPNTSTKTTTTDPSMKTQPGKKELSYNYKADRSESSQLEFLRSNTAILTKKEVSVLKNNGLYFIPLDS